ncbi:37149_t:CDS:2 [Gigaspora margarita]|uniref:37149_t:CDS:1 n=2 Tax=Gigasporaceae TaxID=36753 RepID=A0ABN7UYS5_GIGMA|nr:37149_t:CDS:2 [Gigaspora margarita]
MSINPTSLRTKKKSELIKIAEELGLESTGIRNELIDRIRKHLEVKNDEISTDINPIGTSSRPDPNVSSSDPTTERQITTSSPRDPDESETSDSDSRQQEITINARSQDTSSSDESNLDYNTSRNLPIIATVPIPSIFKDSSRDVYNISIPNILFIIEWHRFWRPLISFLFYLFLLPLCFSYIFNLEPQRHVYSPLAFSVAQYGIFFTTAGHFDWAEDVRDFIPDNLIYTGAGSAVIFSLYESILSMSRTF